MMQAIGETIEEVLARLAAKAEEAKALRARLELWAATQPLTRPCAKHPHVIRERDLDESSRQTAAESERHGEEKFLLIYQPCPECVLDERAAREGNWLKAAGVPAILCAASFKTFRIEGDEDEKNLIEARRYARRKKGFLLLTGNIGDGKSFLAAAILREIGAGLFITHNDLLLELRRGYGDAKAEDVILKAQRTRLLVIDDFGLSMGGRDELPMLQSILDHRYGEALPFIITSNLTAEGVYESVGARLADRLKQATFALLKFSGQSSRKAERSKYFA
jgi:DNA replication protein DnaC